MVAQARDGGALVHRHLGPDRAGDGAPDGRLGDHLALHAASGAGGDGRAGRPGGGRAGAIPPRLRNLEDLPQQRQDELAQDARADAGGGRDRTRRSRGRRVRIRGRDVQRLCAGARRRGREPAGGTTGLRGGDSAEDADARGRDRRRLPDAVDHDARVRPLHPRKRQGRYRHRLHGGRLDRRRPRRGP